MDDWLLELGPRHRVLDIASAGGSFPVVGLACSVIAIDEDPDAFGFAVPLPRADCWRVIGRSEQLPVASASIDLVVCNHALEHFLELDGALEEMGRVLKPDGRLYVAVPDGYGLCDSVYRWVFDGGGHVNRFRRGEIVTRVESRAGVHLAQWQKLYSSFAYLRTIPDLLATAGPDLQGRLKRLARLPRPLVKATQCGLYAGTRGIDRLIGTDLAIYGWALWFDRGAGRATESAPYLNVCMRCGAGHPAESVPRLRWRSWMCPSCLARNPLWLPTPARDAPL
jgi:SAM-dependent methyltransferase